MKKRELRPDAVPTASTRKLKLCCEAVFLSDLHLGSSQCEADGLLQFLSCIRPKSLVLVGDVLDLQALRHHSGSDAPDVEQAVVSSLLDCEPSNLFDQLLQGLSPWLPEQHRQVLLRLARLIDLGVEVVLIPGNHDALLRDFCPRSGPGWRLCHEMAYRTALGTRILAVHGDEEDALVHLHDGLVQALVSSQETYTSVTSRLHSWMAGLTAGADPDRRCRSSADGDDPLAEAIELLNRHWPTLRGVSRLDRHGLSPAFTIERLVKRSLGHDRQFKRQLLNRVAVCRSSDHQPEVVVCGHTHIPEATRLALPQAWGPSPVDQPRYSSHCHCHVTYINDGSWARSQARLGRTALVIDHDGGIGMVQLDQGGRIVAYQPPRFRFNTYPMRRCPRCGVLAAVA